MTRRHGGSALVLASTGKAVDVAVREGAGDEGLTIAKALQRRRFNADGRPTKSGK
jgi:hypothetical protein